MTRVVRRPKIDRKANAVVFEGVTHDFGKLPTISREYLGLLGLKTALLVSAHPAATTYKALLAGHIPDDKPLTQPRKSKWRSAIAHALAAQKAESEAVKGARRSLIEFAAKSHLAAMEAHAAGLDAELVKRLSKRDDVQEHYRILHGSREADQQMSLLAIAGVVTTGEKLPLPPAKEETVMLPSNIEEEADA